MIVAGLNAVAVSVILNDRKLVTPDTLPEATMVGAAMP